MEESIVGRFKVTKKNSDVMPHSIFDEKESLRRRQSFFRSISVDNLDMKKQSWEDHTCLTLYEDDLRHRKIVDLQDGATNHLQKANLGTFFGVFLPCCQNIVGVIFFVRFPWIVGCAGMLEGLIIVGSCCLVSITVAISISAIATNGKVTGGGTYFMISRSLGPAFGGSVGILFFMGTSISVAMYYIGTVETLLNYIAPEISIFGGDETSDGRYNDFRVFGTILLVVMATVVFIGVTCVQRFGLFAILFLVAAIASTLTGIFMANEQDSVKVCKMGNRVFSFTFVNKNGTWYCDKDKDGPIYMSFCHQNGSCDKYFEDNDVKLVPAIPGFQLRLIQDNMFSKYTAKGKIPDTDVDAMKQRDIMVDLTTSFVVLLAIYFPSITGVESGSNYSGDLKDPHRSIPCGTMVAVSVTSLLYMSAVVLFSASVESPVLLDKYGQSISENGELMLSMLAWPSKWVVLVGTLTATIGAGLQALAGGPRLLLAIAVDNIFPILSCFAWTWKGEPTRCLCITFLIALSGILIAKLDYVAPVVTMFFLMCYGFINLAVTLQSLLDLPHWRPSFKCYHWSVTLLGAALCITIMFLSSWIYAIIAIILNLCLYQYIVYKGAEKEWGDGMTGLSMSAAIYALGRLKPDYCHTKNWRPQVMVLLKPHEHETTDFSMDNQTLIQLSMMMQMGKGLTMFGSVIEGNLSDHADDLPLYKKIYYNKLANLGAKGFVDVTISPSMTDGLSCLLQGAGLGPLHPNTVIMGWPKNWERHGQISTYQIFLDTMKTVGLCDNAVILLKASSFPTIKDKIFGTIDVWWIVNDGGMLLLIAHLLRRTKTWSRCRLRVFSVADSNDNTIQIEKDIKKYLYELRMQCTFEMVEMTEGDISAYVYERTLKLEERSRLLAHMSKSKMNKDAQNILDQARNTNDGKKNKEIEMNRRNVPSAKNVRHMQTALTLNKLMREKSSHASVTIMNLPSVPETSTGQANYMSFLEILTEKMDNMILVRGTGREVITIFN